MGLFWWGEPDDEGGDSENHGTGDTVPCSLLTSHTDPPRGPGDTRRPDIQPPFPDAYCDLGVVHSLLTQEMFCETALKCK